MSGATSADISRHVLNTVVIENRSRGLTVGMKGMFRAGSRRSASERPRAHQMSACRWQLEMHCTTRARFGPDAPIERLDDSLCDREPEPGPTLGSLSSFVMASERLKRCLAKPFRKARTVVDDRDPLVPAVHLDRYDIVAW